MKTEFLQNFKIGEQALPKEAIDAILAENGRDVEAAKKPFSDYEEVKKQLFEASKTIEGFKSMDIDAIKKEADNWKSKAEQAEKNAAAKVAEAEFHGKLTAAITGAKGRNAKAVMALLNLDALKNSKNQEADIKSALDTLKKDNDYLFEIETPPPYAAGTGKNNVLSGNSAPGSLAGALKERYN